MQTNSFSRSNRRAVLLATTLLASALASPALAQEARPDYTPPEAQSGGLVQTVVPDPQIVIANPGTPTTARDTTNINGVGQMVINNGDGTIGLCTATLINPRTVIYAAHCVNTRAATAYGANSGGTPIAFGFEAYTRSSGAGLPDELFQWYTGVNANKTNVAAAWYNANQVVYNPYSLEPAALSFLYGDVAMATLDTPAANIPTWALMFSPLGDPGTIGAAGTGYNVKITGYGRNGTGSAGAGPSIDYRRRSAENMIGALTDLETFEQFLFGGAANGLTQNLYMLDFDDPLRGLSGASPFDFNAFRDNARMNGSTPTEGTTSSGDSGGPLILQNFAKQVVIGVLSGGYSRFYGTQAPYSYGAVSFYQPLYLYWDWIAQNNAYHYVSAVAGDGAWTDPNHWVTSLDPAYNILSGGSVVNGIPTVPGAQKNGTTGDFGQICFQNATTSDCLDTKTGIETITGGPIGTVGNSAGVQRIGGEGLTLEAVREAQSTPQMSVGLPAATLANGLPGATNFVPNNADPVRTTGTLGKYFDVTLANAGTTTLSGADITIDRLTIGTAAAGLNIASGASLSTLINTTQFAGTVTVNGTLSSVGDYSLLGGAMLGSGRVNAPFLTSVLGQFAPGTQTGIGTLTIGGNLVMASGTGYYVNLGGGTSSDKIAVVAQGTSTGQANVGGSLYFSPASGSTIHYGELYTILTADGGVSGTFNNPGSLSAILKPTMLYGANQVQVRIDAATYASVINPASAVQSSYASLLDANRGSGNLLGIYNVLDLQTAGTIQSTLEGLAPRSETLRSALGTLVLDNGSRLIRQRLGSLTPGSLGGAVAYYGRPSETNALIQNRIMGMSMAGGMAGAAGGSMPASTEEGRLPETMSAFLAGGYLDGKAAPMAGAVPMSGDDKFNGWYIAGGIESQLGDNGLIGLAINHTDVDGTTLANGGTVGGKLTSGTLYTKFGTGLVTMDAQLSAGQFSSDTVRPGNLPGNPYTLQSHKSSLALAGEINFTANLAAGGFNVGPHIGARYSHIELGRSLETGGPTALVIDRDDFESLQTRVGVDITGKGKVRPFVSANYVHEFNDHPAVFDATFVGALPSPTAHFALGGQDKNWFEVAGGLTITAGKIDLSISADTTIDRFDVKNQAYRASATIRF